MKLKTIHSDVWISVVLIVCSVILYVMAGNFYNPSAAVWPKAVLIATMILSTMLLIRGLRLTAQKADAELIPPGDLVGSMLSFAAIIAYAVTVKFAGYFVSTAIFVPLGMFLLGQRNWKAIIGVTAGLELFVYLLFVVQLQLRMP